MRYVGASSGCLSVKRGDDNVNIIIVFLTDLLDVVSLLAIVFFVGIIAATFLPAGGLLGWIGSLCLSFVGLVLIIGGFSINGLYMLFGALLLLATLLVVQFKHSVLRAKYCQLNLATFTGLMVAIPFVDVPAVILIYPDQFNAVVHMLLGRWWQYGIAMPWGLLSRAIAYSLGAALVVLIFTYIYKKNPPHILGFAGIIGATSIGSFAAGMMCDFVGYCRWALFGGLLLASLGTAFLSLFAFTSGRPERMELSDFEKRVLHYLQERQYQISLSHMAQEFNLTEDEIRRVLENLKAKKYIRL